MDANNPAFLGRRGERTMERHEWWQSAAAEEPADTAPQPLAARASKLSFWALLAFTLVLILAPQAHFASLKPLHLAFLFAVIASAAYLLGWFRHGSASARRPEFLWAALLLFWAVITVPFSLWPGGSFDKITEIFLKALIVFWLIGCVVDTPARLKTLIWLLTLISIPLSLSAVHSFFTGGFSQQIQTEGGARISGYAGGLTGNPNDLALMINLIFALTIGLIFCTRRLSLRLFLTVLAVLDIFAVVATYSRGGFLVMAVILCAHGLCLLKRGAWLPVLVAVALVVLAVPMLHGGGYASRISTITSVQADPTGSAEARAQGMKDAANYALHNPIIGAGIGMSQLQLDRIRGRGQAGEIKGHSVHDVYLMYLMELGVPGLILFLLLLYGALKSTRHACRVAARRSEQRDLYFLAQGIGISLIGFAVSAIFHPSAYQFYFFYIAGLAVAASTIASRISAQQKHDQDASLPAPADPIGL